MQQKRSSRDGQPVSVLRIVDVYAPTALPIMVSRRLVEKRLPGLGIELLAPLETGPELIGEVLNGRVDIAPVCELPIFRALADDAPIEIIGVTGTFRRAIVVPADSELSLPEQLRGRRVACVMDGGARTVLRGYLAQIGLDESDVELVDLSPSEALNALTEDKFDAWTTWSPWVDQVELDGRGRVLVDISHVKTHGLDFVARKSLRSDRPEVVAAFLEAYAEAGAWGIAFPEEAMNHFKPVSGVRVEAIAHALRSGIHFRPFLTENMAADLVEGLHRAHQCGYAAGLDVDSLKQRLPPARAALHATPELLT